ncbi:hypothetical protein V7128_22595 [Neobacillus vireti]
MNMAGKSWSKGRGWLKYVVACSVKPVEKLGMKNSSLGKEKGGNDYDSA